MFHDNFSNYADGVSDAVRAAGPVTSDADVAAVRNELAHADNEAPAG
jgi:hypothetical protein